jgi:hypothetical protein
MGLMDRAREAAGNLQGAAMPTQTHSQPNAGIQPAPAARPSGCPGRHYMTEVNKGSIRMGSWENHLNDMWGQGYKLEHVFEQDGNTVQVYAHHYHA